MSMISILKTVQGLYSVSDGVDDKSIDSKESDDTDRVLNIDHSWTKSYSVIA